ALEQGGQHAERGEQSATDVRDCAPDAQGAATGVPGHRHDPGKSLRDLIESGPLAIRAVLSEAGDAREHDPAVYLAQRCVVDAEPVFYVGPIVFDDDVRRLDQTEKDFAALRRLEVERNRALVAMQVLEV